MFAIKDELSAPSISNVSALKYRWVNSVDDISQDDWELCFLSGDVIRSYQFQRSLERSNMKFVEFHYLLVYSESFLVAIIPCFKYYYSIVDVAGQGVRNIVDYIRRIAPQFLYVNIFVIGSPVAICKDMLGINKYLKDTHIPDGLYLKIVDEAIDYGTKKGVGLFALKELQSTVYHHLAPILSERLFFAESPATTYLYSGDIDGIDYSSLMLSRYRKVLRKRKKDFSNAGFHWEVHEDFSAYIKDIQLLYENILNNASEKFEKLTPEFFKEVNDNLQKNSCALLCFQGKKLIAFELILIGDNIHPIYLGLDYEFNEKGSIYFNCLYRIIEEAKKRNFSYVELGQTSYEAKLGVGAVVDRLYIGLYHKNKLFNWLLRVFKRGLFPETKIPASRSVFKDPERYFHALKSKGISFEEVE